MKLKNIVFFLLLITIKSFGTAQVPDKIIFNGIKYDLMSNPLEVYFNKFPEKKPLANTNSTALWRGYIATFEVFENKLFVKDIVVQEENDSLHNEIKEVSIFKAIFGNVERFNCDFFSGLLVLPYGELINYVHMGYSSTYANYILLEINESSLVNIKEYDYKEYLPFKELQYRAFKKTVEYKKVYGEMLKMFEDTEEQFDKEFDKNGDETIVGNKYLKEKERIWTRDKQIDNFIRMFTNNYTSIILTN